MKHTFMTIYPMILMPFSSGNIRPKLCIDCKFYTKHFLTRSKFGKCTLFTIENSPNSYLVNGNNDNNIEYDYCSIARQFDHMCGKEGKYYEKK